MYCQFWKAILPVVVLPVAMALVGGVARSEDGAGAADAAGIAGIAGVPAHGAGGGGGRSGSGVDSGVFKLEGRIENQKMPMMVRLNYKGEHGLVHDSVVVTDGRFEFHGSVVRPTSATVVCSPAKGDPGHSQVRVIYLEAGTTVIHDNSTMDAAIVTGSPETAVADEWRVIQESYRKRRDDFTGRRFYNRGNKDSVRFMDAGIRRADLAIADSVGTFVAKYPNSYVSWDLVSGLAVGMEPERIEPGLKALGPKFKDSKEGKAIAAQLEQVRKVVIGVKSPEFVQSDVQGATVSLLSFRGRYVLVDFWASWCGICRAENPNVLKAYKAYKDRGFTVLGVSLDDSAHKDKWIQAIKEDNMPWQQVSDLKGTKNSAAVLYGIKGIPQNVLIGPDGVIVAKNLRDRDLMAKLMEIFDGDKNMKMDGHIAGLTDERIVFPYYCASGFRRDTVTIHGGDFTWLTVMPEPQQIEAVLLPSGRTVRIYSDIGYLQLSGTADTLDHIKVKGSWLDDDAAYFRKMVGDTSDKQKVKAYIYGHPGSLYALILLNQMQGDKDVYPMYMNMAGVLRATPTGRRLGAALKHS